MRNPGCGTAAHDAESVERRLVVVARVVRATIRVMHEARVRLAAADSGGERFEYERAIDALAHREAHHAAREQVDDRREVQPPLGRPDVRDLRHPREVRRVDLEVAIEDVLRDRQGARTSKWMRGAPYAPRPELVRCSDA